MKGSQRDTATGSTTTKAADAKKVSAVKMQECVGSKEGSKTTADPPGKTGGYFHREHC
jgi:hypothetical protein